MVFVGFILGAIFAWVITVMWYHSIKNEDGTEKRWK